MKVSHILVNIYCYNIRWPDLSKQQWFLIHFWHLILSPVNATYTSPHLPQLLSVQLWYFKKLYLHNILQSSQRWSWKYTLLDLLASQVLHYTTGPVLFLQQLCVFTVKNEPMHGEEFTDSYPPCIILNPDSGNTSHVLINSRLTLFSEHATTKCMMRPKGCALSQSPRQIMQTPWRHPTSPRCQ